MDEADLPRAPGLRLDGRVALVTGAGRGIGLACASALADAGAETILLSRSESQLSAAAEALSRRGARADYRVCDVTDAAAVERCIGSLDRLDVLVNNAGMNRPQLLVDVTLANLDAMLSLNLRAAFLVAQAAVRKMLEDRNRRERGGAVINVTSQMGHVGAATRSVYCMTKHGLEGLTKAMAVELATHNIRVNSLAPTFVETPMTRPMFANASFRAEVLARIPLGRLGTLDEIASAVVFLASPGASLMTGASLVVDGGWTAQ